MNKYSKNQRGHCPNISELAEYLCGNMLGIEKETLSHHIENCSYCEDVLKELKEFVGDSPDAEVKEYYIQNIFNKSQLSNKLLSLIRDKEALDRKSFLSSKDYFMSHIKKLNKLISSSSLNCTTYIYSHEAVRGLPSNKNSYSIGERIIIRIETPQKDGYLVVFHYDAEYNLELIFPSESYMDNFVKADDNISIGIKATKPKGIHYLKAIWSFKPIIKVEEINYEDEDIASILDELFHTLPTLKDFEWIESVLEMKVV